MTLDWVHVYNVPKIMSGERNINSFEEMLRDGRLWLAVKMQKHCALSSNIATAFAFSGAPGTFKIFIALFCQM